MKMKNRILTAMMLAAVLGISIMGGCSDQKEADAEKKTAAKEENPTENDASGEESTVRAVGTFETTDIDGNAYTETIFAEHELTLVNVFATWCSPCVQELPDLQKLSEEVADQGVGVVGIVMDTVDEKGNPDQEGVEKAKVLKEQAEITYPILIPDSGNLNGRLSAVQAFPTTFFVDKTGNIVGQTYEGSADLEIWKEVVETELASLNGEKE